MTAVASVSTSARPFVRDVLQSRSDCLDGQRGAFAAVLCIECIPSGYGERGQAKEQIMKEATNRRKGMISDTMRDRVDV
jgi:hypothetical protein